MYDKEKASVLERDGQRWLDSNQIRYGTLEGENCDDPDNIAWTGVTLAPGLVVSTGFFPGVPMLAKPWLLESITDEPRTMKLLVRPKTNSNAETILGIALNHSEFGQIVKIAGPGSFAVAKCGDADADAPLKTAGTWVGCDGAAIPGELRSYTTAEIVAAANQGRIVGRIVVPAGTGAGKTGSNFYCGIIVMPR